MKKLIIASIFLITSQTLLAQVSVGWDASCDYDESIAIGQIQQAIDDNEIEVRVTNQQEFNTSITINDNVIIKGGYNTCADANDDNQSSSPTVIDGISLTQSSIKIDTLNAVRTISIDNFELKNVTNSNDRAGGITIYNSSGNINLSQLSIHDNSDSLVGGLSIYNDGFFCRFCVAS